MGYCMNLREGKFRISAKNLPEAYKALTALAAQSPKQRYGHFSWVQNEVLARATTVADHLKEWRWPAKFDTDGNLVDVNFDGEKLGDDQVLFNVLAPYVDEGSYLVMYGEDGMVWRWLFTGGKCLEQDACVSFGSPGSGDVIDVEAREVGATKALPGAVRRLT